MSQTKSPLAEVACAIFYTHQTSGGSGVCTCNHMHQMEKTELGLQQMNIHVIIQVKKIEEFDVIQFYLNHLQFSNVSTDTTVILKEKILNEKST